MNCKPTTVYQSYIALFVFALAMGILEAIVVVYVRELYYPNGFVFPLKTLPKHIVAIEIIRELSTLLMLGSVAWIAGKNGLKRLSAFLFLFGIWDIVYYIALKVFLNWPESFFTWDILFLIPITWVGPVLAPLICSFLMILMALLFDYYQSKRRLYKLTIAELLLLFAGSAVIFISFTIDFGLIIWRGNFSTGFFSLPENEEFTQIVSTWIPGDFLWGVFGTGILSICAAILLIWRRAANNTASRF
ncbi:hypothetical protein [uncultured Draconibacterium sp.]|uniref:hypothetical protein n=2 Tax=uncultured Draconibacterium sp. TaxID=1573823 RepID=UPI003216FDA2